MVERPKPRGRSFAKVAATVAAVVAIIAALLLGAGLISLQFAFPDQPDLYRPRGYADGSLRLSPGAPPILVRLRLSLTPEAVRAAQAGDGLVYLELDLSGHDGRPIAAMVGLRTDGSAAPVRELAELEPGADVRWTVACEPDSICERLVEVSFASPVRADGPVEIEWLLTAEVRPPPGTQLYEGASVSLIVDEEDR